MTLADRRGCVTRAVTRAKPRPIQAERENVNSRPVARMRATTTVVGRENSASRRGRNTTITSATTIRPPKALGSISSPDSRVPSPLSADPANIPRFCKARTTRKTSVWAAVQPQKTRNSHRRWSMVTRKSSRHRSVT